jgi:hypothetical protein
VSAVELDRWQPAPRRRYFAIGDEVRLEGERGGHYRILGFGQELGVPTVDIVGGKRGRAPRVRTVYAVRLRR